MKHAVFLGHRVVEEEEEEGVREEEEIVFGAFDAYVVWKLRKKRAEEGLDK